MEINGLIGFGISPEASSLIQSIQSGDITVSSGSNSSTATINAVNIKCAVCFFNGWRSADTSLASSEDYPRISLTNATTVTAQTAASNPTTSRVVRYTVVEFKPFAIKSIQQGIIAISGSNTSATATINAVNTARAFVIHQGQNHSVTQNDYNYNQGKVALTNATTVTASKDSGSNPTLTVGYTVVEFNQFIVKGIQQVTVTIAAAASAGDATISTVNDTAALLVYGGWNVHLAATNDPTRAPHVRRTSTTNVRATRNTASTSSIEVNCTVIEFETRWVKSRQANQTQILAGASSTPVSISTINTAKSMISWLGWNCNLNTGGDDGPYTIAQINSATQMSIERGGVPSIITTQSWEIMEFV